MSDSYHYLVDIALILIATKGLGMLTRKVQMPQVVGALLAGLLLGPACLDFVKDTSVISALSEIGVIVLMFSAGLDTDIKELKKSGLPGFVIALIGVLVPLAGGFLVAKAYNPGASEHAIIQDVFVGVVLTATSVSITVETLKELGKLNTRSGNAILSAALIDDLLGILGLTIVTSFADKTVSIGLSLLKVLGFVAVCVIMWYFAQKILVPWFDGYSKGLQRMPIIAFFICLLMSYAAERFFGISDITGAYVAGLMVSTSNKSTYMESRFNTLSFLLLSPVFFASVGLKVSKSDFSKETIVLSLVLIGVAVVSKVIGCGLGARMCRYDKKESMQIGVGMVSRGEVALIVESQGIALKLMPDGFYAPLLLAVVATTILTPILLKLVYKDQEKADEIVSTELLEKHNEQSDLEHFTENVYDEHVTLKENARKSLKSRVKERKENGRNKKS